MTPKDRAEQLIDSFSFLNDKENAIKCAIICCDETTWTHPSSDAYGSRKLHEKTKAILLAELQNNHGYKLIKN